MPDLNWFCNSYLIKGCWGEGGHKKRLQWKMEKSWACLRDLCCGVFDLQICGEI